MIVYRIADDRFASDLSGSGGLYSSGRWNRLGTPIVYLTEHVSLAKLEILAHSPALPKGRSLVTVSIPDDASITYLDPASLPENWNEWPYLDALTDITEQWISERTYWIMCVPSAQSPIEKNYLLNPLHPEHATLKLIGIEPHPFATRLK